MQYYITHGSNFPVRCFINYHVDLELAKIALSVAKYSVAVVGDPVALCALGSAHTFWKQYVEHCGKHESLFPPETFSVPQILGEAQELIRALALPPPLAASTALLASAPAPGSEADALRTTDESSVVARASPLQATSASGSGVPYQHDSKDEAHSPVDPPAPPPATSTSASVQQAEASRTALALAAATRPPASARIEAAGNARSPSSERRSVLEEITETEMSLVEVNSLYLY